MQRTNSKERVVLEAVCVKFCKNLSKRKYQWYIDFPNFDHGANSKTSEDTKIFEIYKNVLKPGERYLIYVKIGGTFFHAMHKIKKIYIAFSTKLK